jgi:hypothetical protein
VHKAVQRQVKEEAVSAEKVQKLSLTKEQHDI